MCVIDTGLIFNVNTNNKFFVMNVSTNFIVKQNFVFESHRCTVHFVKSLQLLNKKWTYIYIYI